ncbi:hypothetical protein AB4Z35_29845, partial [Pseudomonas sp. KB_15]
MDAQQKAEDRAIERRFNRGMLLRLLVVVGLMFSFGYALVPLYKKRAAEGGRPGNRATLQPRHAAAAAGGGGPDVQLRLCAGAAVQE